jgi:gas vesicle protein
MPDLTKEGLPIFKSKSSDFTEDGLPILKKKEGTTPDSPIGTQTSKRGFEPFQSQVDTKTPSVLLSDEQKQQREQDRIAKRFETTLLNVPTEFGKIDQFMRSAKKVKDTLPQAPTMKPDTGGMVVIPQGEKIGESLRKGDTFQDVVTDKFTDKKTALQKQIENAENAYRTVQGDEMADQARAQSGEQPMAFESGYENIAPLMSGIQGTVSSFYKIPRYIYDVFAIPQNLVAKLADVEGLEANYENVSKGTFNPLAYLEYAGRYTKGEEEKWQSRQRQYDEDIATQLFSTGDFGGAALQIFDNVVASAPSIAAMFVSGGAANAAKLGSISSKIAIALPFASAQNQALVENENIPQWLKPVNAAFNGLSEILLEGKFGTTAILSGATKVIAEQGAEVAAKSMKDFVYNYIKKALSKVQPITDVVSNAMEEMATLVSQNIIARATGEDPNRGIMDGVADAGIVGGAQGAGASAIRKGFDIITNKKSKDKVEKLSKQRDDIVNDLDNKNIPDAVKEQLEVKLEGITEELNNTLDKNREEIKNLPEEVKLEVAELADKIEAIK